MESTPTWCRAAMPNGWRWRSVGLIADPERADRLGANAYRRARETYDLPRVADRLDVAVRRVAAARSAQLIEVTA